MVMTNPLDAWTARQIGRPGAPLTRAELAAYQLHQLRQTLDWVKANSPFYRRRLAGFDAARLTTLDALRQLPFTTADDLRTNDPPLLCVSQSEVSRVVTLETSATSGPAKRIFFTAHDQAATLDFFDHGMRLLTQPGDRVLILFPGERPGSVGDLLAQALTRQGATPIAYGWPQGLAAAAAALHRERPDVVVGAPVPLLAVARYAAAAGLPVRVRSVLLSADQANAAVRRGLTQLWGCEIFEHYGMTEMGLGGGVDCAAHAGYHLRESELLVEIVDPESGEPVADGEPGELIFTTLTRRGMPLVRYRSGDLLRRLTGACACGSPLARIERIHRRVGGGVDCAAHAGYHLRESELLVEIVDPASGEPVADGEPGEVVFTALTRRGMPLIRYRSGDISRRLTGACACGSKLTRLERIHRRIGGGVQLDDAGELLIGALDEAIFPLASVADFAATFAAGPPPTLRLDVARVAGQQSGDDALVAEVCAALQALPMIKVASAAQGLRLSVNIAAESGRLCHAGKRTITTGTAR